MSATSIFFRVRHLLRAVPCIRETRFAFLPFLLFLRFSFMIAQRIYRTSSKRGGEAFFPRDVSHPYEHEWTDSQSMYAGFRDHPRSGRRVFRQSAEADLRNQRSRHRMPCRSWRAAGGRLYFDLLSIIFLLGPVYAFLRQKA